MTIVLRIRNESGNVDEMRIDPGLVDRMAPLLEMAAWYFDLSIEHRMIPLGLLVASRARPNGVISANGLMSQAASNLVAKRSPITVSPLDDETFLVEDGNSTFVNALVSGWATIPCAVLPREK